MIAEHSGANMMTATNLATCFAPSLLRAPAAYPPQRALDDIVLCISAVKAIIKGGDRRRRRRADRPSKGTTRRHPDGKGP